jgi:2-octaprenyl-6-methoxyphenol hydroxylase
MRAALSSGLETDLHKIKALPTREIDLNCGIMSFSEKPMKSETSVETDVCIVGAGPVGGSLACRLGMAGVRVAVIDRAPLPPMEHPDFDGRAYAIAAGSRRLLQLAGVWERLPQTPCPIHHIRVSDGRVGQPASSLFLHFDRHEVDAEAFGWMVEARALRVALNAQLHALSGVMVFAPAQVSVERTADSAIVLAETPEVRVRLTCRLVVAADGRESGLRTQAGIPITRFGYDQTGIVTAVAHERDHQNVALEHFLPAGPFAQLPMSPTPEAPHVSAPHVSAIVWTERRAAASRLLALDDARFGREIARRLGGHLGQVRPIGRRWSYPLGALHAHRYYADRLALIGDAAHGIHPIAGQGLNLGFRDVAALATLLTEAGDPGASAVLAAYQRQRRPDNLLMLAATDGLDRLFSSDNPMLRLMRDVGIATVHRAPRLKRLFMRTAMGAS